jgi:hypothetical protein
VIIMAQLINSTINLMQHRSTPWSIPSSGDVTIPVGGTLTLDFGSCTLLSPNYPNNYLNNTDGYVTFTGIPDVVRRISGFIDTESGYDFIRIYDGAGVSGGSTSVTGTGPFSFTSAPGQTFTVRFTSDSSTTSGGFSLTVEGSYIAPGTLYYRRIRTDSSSAVTIPTTGNNYFSSTRGTLQSPNYPSSYSINTDGHTIFEGQVGVTRTVKGTINTESGYDFIRVYNGSGISGKLLYTVSGLNQPFSFTSAPGQTFTVRFNSDSTTSSTGFSLAVDSDAEGFFVEDSGANSPYRIGGTSARSTRVSKFTSNGTWVNPLYQGENIGAVLVLLFGGGGGGSSGPNSTTDPTLYALGGGGGGASIMLYPALSLGLSYLVTVGAGGAGGNRSGPNFTGGKGGSTQFGSIPSSISTSINGLGAAQFGALYAGGGNGGTRIATGDVAGGMGLYIGSPGSTISTRLHATWYSGPGGGRGSGGGGISHPGGTGGWQMNNTSTSLPTLAGGANGLDSAAVAGAGAAGSNPPNAFSPTGTSLTAFGNILRAGSGGGGGGRATASGGTAGDGGAGGPSAGGGGGGAAVTGATAGNGGAGGAGLAVIISW